MAARLKAALGVDAELIAQGKGIFDVTVDGNLVFSKFTAGGFPDEDKLVDTIAAMR